jgi:hypothetical protein
VKWHSTFKYQKGRGLHEEEKSNEKNAVKLKQRRFVAQPVVVVVSFIKQRLRSCVGKRVVGEINRWDYLK